MNRLLYLLTAACCLAVSCKSDPVPAAASAENEPVQIVFSAVDAMSARVSTKTDPITDPPASFNTSATTGTTTETQVWNNEVFTASAGKYTGDKYWPLTETQLHFYASNADLTFSDGGCSVVDVYANQTDVICAYHETPTYKVENELAFEHIFARIGTVSITPPAGYQVSSGLRIYINPYIKGTYNLKTRSWTGKAPDNSSPMKTIATATGNNANDLWLVPGTYTLTATYTLTKGSGGGSYSKNFTRTAIVTVVGGCINTIETTLPQGTAEDIVFNVSVTPWDNHTVTASFS